MQCTREWRDSDMLTAARWSCHAHEVSNHVIERVSEASDVHGSTGSTCETKRKREKKTRAIEAGQTSRKAACPKRGTAIGKCSVLMTADSTSGACTGMRFSSHAQCVNRRHVARTHRRAESHKSLPKSTMLFSGPDTRGHSSEQCS
jgi:hypothetical protein